MGIGSALVALALLLIVVAYLARPFRTQAFDPEQVLEAWVARSPIPGQAEGVGGVNYCRQCGRRVAPGDQFCPGCGTRLQGGGK